MGDAGTRASTRPIGALAQDLADTYEGFIDADGRCAWNIGVLVYGDTIDDVYEGFDHGRCKAIDMIRYLLAALPRSFVLPPNRQAKADALKAEMRAMVGGCL